MEFQMQALSHLRNLRQKPSQFVLSMEALTKDTKAHKATQQSGSHDKVNAQ